jgi:DNA (cytosine-5)-methyltransferase 1
MRKSPLVDRTLERIYAGLIKFVAGGKDAFLVKYNSWSKSGRYIAPSVDEPSPVVATQNRLGVAKVQFLSKQYGGDPAGKNIRIEEPAGSVTCKDHHALVNAHFIDAYYGNGHEHSIDEPAPVVRTVGHLALVDAHFIDIYYGNGFNKSIDEPAPTVLAKDKMSLVTSRFFANEYSGGGQLSDINSPSPAVTTVPKMKLVSVDKWIMNTHFNNVGSSLDEPSPVITANHKYHYLMNPQFASKGGSIDSPCFTLIARMDKMPPYLITTEQGEVAVVIYESDSQVMRKIKEFMAIYGIVDIKMRMLNVSELKRIMGFGSDYTLIGTQTEQKKYIGNAVEVNMARVLCEALAKELNTIIEA